MTTDKERAAAYRLVAAELPTDAYWDGPGLTRRADELDPPKPEYPDGTLAWLAHPNGDRLLCEWSTQESNWCIGGKDGDSIPSQRCSVEPLRVLADDEIALPRAAFDLAFGPRDSARARQYAETAGFQGFSAAASVFRAYADALDAEAGDQS